MDYIQTLIDEKNLCIVNQSDYRVAFAYAYGCMNIDQREYYDTHIAPSLIEYTSTVLCRPGEIIMPLDALDNAKKLISEYLHKRDMLPLQTVFLFYQIFPNDEILAKHAWNPK